MVKAQTVVYDLVGWLYAEKYGWISLTSENCQTIFNQTNNPLCAPQGDDGSRVTYNVSLAGNEISGWGWSEAGWVCFGLTCSAYGNPPIGQPIMTIDEQTKKISGWGKILSLNENGWISFGQALPPTSDQIGQICYNCQPVCLSWTQSCVGSPAVCSDVEPCLAYATENYESCRTCFSETYFSGQAYPVFAPDPVAGGSGYACADCVGSGLSGDENEFCHKTYEAGASRVFCAQCSAANCELHRSFLDSLSGRLLGWAWNSYQESAGGAKFGSGWIHLNNDYAAAIVYPWLETKFGAIYGRGSVRQKAGVAANNATYCIFAQNIQGVRSADCQAEKISGVDIAFPSVASIQPYYNALGKIDIVGISTAIHGIISKNKYGQFVSSIDSGAIDSWSAGKVLAGAVYVTAGDLTISRDLLIQNGVGTQKGGGTVVVNGNLTINGNISYQVSLPDNLDQLASVAWIVKGDVIVSPAAEKIVGAFLILGDGSACSKSIGDYPVYSQTGCGVFFSGASAAKSLTVSGLIVARAFDFRRAFADSVGGSERIIYDGRLIANPPPGLDSLAEGLPVIRDFSY